MSSIAGRAIIVTKTNKSGGGLAKGDVVVVDSANDNAITTTTSGGTTVTVGVVVEENGIANNASGRVQFGGHVGLVNVNASVTRGHYGYTHTVAKQAADAGASRVVGTFCVFTTGGTTPEADLFTQPDGSSASGNVATDVIWDAKGDLAAGTGANTAAKLTAGANGSSLIADSTQSTGLNWLVAKVYSDNAVATSQTQSGNNSWANLATTGPAVTVTVPASGVVKVSLAANMSNSSQAGYMSMGFAISGATTQAAGTANAAGEVMTLDLGGAVQSGSGGTIWTPQLQCGATYLLTGLAAGSTTFTAKYNQFGTAGTATYANRYMIVETCP